MQTLVISMADDFEIGILADEDSLTKIDLTVGLVKDIEFPLNGWANLLKIINAHVCVKGDCPAAEDFIAMLTKRNIYLTLDEFLCMVQELEATPYLPT